MIKLKSLILETVEREIIVGTISSDGKIFASDKWLTHGYMRRDTPTLIGVLRYDWRYNKRLKILFWWRSLSKINDNLKNMVVDYIHNVGFDVEKEVSLDDAEEKTGEYYSTQHLQAHGEDI